AATGTAAVRGRWTERRARAWCRRRNRFARGRSDGWLLRRRHERGRRRRLCRPWVHLIDLAVAIIVHAVAGHLDSRWVHVGIVERAIARLRRVTVGERTSINQQIGSIPEPITIDVAIERGRRHRFTVTIFVSEAA